MTTVRENVLEALKEKPGHYGLLEKVVEHTDRNPLAKSGEWTAFEYWHVNESSDKRLKWLVEKGVLKIVYESNAHTYYTVADLEETRSGMRTWKEINEYVKVSVEDRPPGDLFDCIIGYDDAKEVFRMAIKSESAVHLLMVSPPASAKSLFLLEMARIPGSVYVLGHSTSKAGLIDFIINTEPKYLLIDELDKMSKEDYSTLLSLMETGIVGEMKYHRTRTSVVRTKVFAACNNVGRIPIELQSRFTKFHFIPYQKKEFEAVVVGVLTMREGTAEDLAKYISECVWEQLNFQDVREAIRIARLCKTRDEVDIVVSAMKKYRSKLVPYNRGG